MKRHFLAGAMAVALATGLATGAMASGHGHRGGVHAGGIHAGHSGLRDRHAGIRGGRLGQDSSGRRFADGYRGAHYEGVAPFGHAVGFGPGHGPCSPDDYGSCGSTFSVGW